MPQYRTSDASEHASQWRRYAAAADHDQVRLLLFDRFEDLVDRFTDSNPAFSQLPLSARLPRLLSQPALGLDPEILLDLRDRHDAHELEGRMHDRLERMQCHDLGSQMAPKERRPAQRPTAKARLINRCQDSTWLSGGEPARDQDRHGGPLNDVLGSCAEELPNPALAPMLSNTE
jgi:hypothetical protein